MNPTLLAIIAGLSFAMLVIFLATGQQLNLTITAVLATGGIATLAVFFYGREEAHEEFGDECSDEPPAASGADDETPAQTQADETQTIEGDPVN